MSRELWPECGSRAGSLPAHTVFRAAIIPQDKITDSNRAAGDFIDLRFMDADTTPSGSQPFSKAEGGVLGPGKVIFAFGELLGDVDGDGAVDLAVNVSGDAVTELEFPF